MPLVTCAYRLVRQHRLLPPFAVGVLIAATLAVTAGVSAYQAGTLAKIKQRFDTSLAKSSWSAADVQKLEGLIGDVGRIDVREQVVCRRQMHKAFVSDVEGMIRERHARSSRDEQLRDLIRRLQPYESLEAVPWCGLDQRMRTWIPLFDLVPPYADAKEVFSENDVCVRDGMLSRVVDERSKPIERVRTKIATTHHAQLEVRIPESSWAAESIVGLALNESGEQNYAFVLRAPLPKTLASESLDDALPKSGVRMT